MAHATFVKSARKDYPEHGIKKGESYYWWSFRQPGGRGGSGKYFSKTPPRPSQLTRSAFQSTLLHIEETFNDLNPESYSFVSEFESDIDSIKSDLESLKDETQEKLDNMPEGLQQGDTGQLLQTRIDEVDSLISDLDSVDFSEPEEPEGEDLKNIMAQNKLKKEEVEGFMVTERCREISDEISGFNWGIE